jgi:CheY-like chemotaxis protein
VPKVLVADDNNNIQKMVALALEERGIKVTSVGNGEAAVRRIPDLSPDLVLADIFMPVRNGYEVCEFVKKDQRFSQIPVVLLIGAFDPLDEKEARRVGADGVLKKPFVPPDPLIAMVLSILEKNPKAAEELKKFKEAKEAPEPHPAFESEAAGKSGFASAAIPTKFEAKPLPNFPEPSPEEAALIYGFGKGRRTVDDPQKGASGDEPPAPRSDADEAAEDEFDGASTARDWRRTAMDFDIPEEAANQPAFAAADNFDASATFPSERDAPAQRVEVATGEKQSLRVDETAALPWTKPSDDVTAPILSESVAPPAAEPLPVTQQAGELPEPTNETQPPFGGLPVVGADNPHAPGPAFNAPHWMDLVAKPADRSQAEWMSRISQAPADYPEIASHELSPMELPKPEAAADVTVTEDAREQPFFADEHAEPAPSFFATLPKIQAPIFEDEPEPASVSSNAEEFEKEQEPAISALFKDPALVEPPAVRVTPEPLLVEEETQGSAGYAVHEQEDTEPLYSFLNPEPAPEETPAAAAQSETQAPEAAAPEFDERVPTMAPPTRQALSEIPFLTPPAGFDPNAKENGLNESEIVDALVQKVMDRLGPQLHVLLSQDVLKPLVENLLQKELTKKDK